MTLDLLQKSETVFEILTPKLPPLIRYSVLGNRSAIAKNISDIALVSYPSCIPYLKYSRKLS